MWKDESFWERIIRHVFIVVKKTKNISALGKVKAFNGDVNEVGK